MSRRARALVSATLFVAIGLVGAFLVSAVAGAWDAGPEEGAPAALQVPAPEAIDPAEVRIEVLNGAGTSGLARAATHALRQDGFDVVFFGNAARFDHARSHILDRTGRPALARAVARSLGVDSVATALDPALMLEVTVVLGSDWPPAVIPEAPLPDRIRGLRLRELLRRDSAVEPQSTPHGTPSGDRPEG
jgi:hypothetical protein